VTLILVLRPVHAPHHHRHPIHHLVTHRGVVDRAEAIVHGLVQDAASLGAAATVHGLQAKSLGSVVHVADLVGRADRADLVLLLLRLHLVLLVILGSVVHAVVPQVGLVTRVENHGKEVVHHPHRLHHRVIHVEAIGGNVALADRVLLRPLGHLPLIHCLVDGEEKVFGVEGLNG